MKLSLLEQETVLLYNQAESAAEVYTHDPKLMKKLEQLAEKYPEQIIKKDDHNFIVPKRCVSVREPYSEKRRKAASERARAAGYAILCMYSFCRIAVRLFFYAWGCRPEQRFNCAIQRLSDPDCRPDTGFAFVVLIVLIHSVRHRCFFSDLRLCLARSFTGRS